MPEYNHLLRAMSHEDVRGDGAMDMDLPVVLQTLLGGQVSAFFSFSDFPPPRQPSPPSGHTFLTVTLTGLQASVKGARSRNEDCHGLREVTPPSRNAYPAGSWLLA